MMDWRSWAYQTLIDATGLMALSSPSPEVFGAGSMEGTPTHKPFIVVMFGQELPDMYDGDVASVVSQYMTLWFHDDPGDYLRIGRMQQEAQLAIVGPVAQSGAIIARWESNSGDLSDDTYGTIVRNSEYRLIGRR